MKDFSRILMVLNHLGIRKSVFAKNLGYKNGNIFRHIEKGRNGISANLAKRIANAYPKINQYWLLTGKGDMLGKEKTKKSDLEERVAFLERYIKGQDARIELLEIKINAPKALDNKIPT